MSAFDSIAYGPFVAKYHQDAVSELFQRALREFLERELLPQVIEPFSSTKGRLFSNYDLDRNCGPHSAVKDVYVLEFSFVRTKSSDDVRGEICYLPAQRAFRLRNPKAPLVLINRGRRDAGMEFRRKVGVILKEVQAGAATGSCPVCASSLRIANAPENLHISCPQGCFHYDFHRDPSTGAWLHGHFFSRPSVV